MALSQGAIRSMIMDGDTSLQPLLQVRALKALPSVCTCCRHNCLQNSALSCALPSSRSPLSPTSSSSLAQITSAAEMQAGKNRWK